MSKQTINITLHLLKFPLNQIYVIQGFGIPTTKASLLRRFHLTSDCFGLKLIILAVIFLRLITVMKYFKNQFELGPLKELPILKQTTKIVRISYPHNAIQKISPSLSKAQNTEQLDLSYNLICTIEPILQLKKLRILCLSHNHIANIPKGVVKLRKLEIIDLANNLLCSLPNISPLFQLYKNRKCEIQIILSGNKVIQQHHQEINERMGKIKEEITKLKEKFQGKKDLKELQISSKSIEMHRRTNSQSASQEKTSSQILPNDNKPVSSLGDAKHQIQISMANLNQLKKKFEVISASEFKGWNENLNGIFQKEAQSVKSLVETYRHIITCLTTQFVNPSDATAKIQIGFIQASQIQELIKDQHSVMLEALSQCHSVPMTSYKIWVQLYRELRNLAERVRWEAWGVIQCQIRNQEIQALKLISPSKPEKNKIQKEDKLEGLLFSKNKQIQVEEKVVCSECFIKNQEVRQLREEIELLTYQNSGFREKLQVLEKQNQQLTKEEGILGKELKKRQQEIIIAINDKIDASVYQKVLLEQAKGIEDLIKCDRHLLKRQKNIFQNTQKLADLCQTATAVAKVKTLGQCKQGVSQFYLQEQQKSSANSGLMKMPYFNKNIEDSKANCKKSKRNTQNSVSSTEKKRKSIFEIGQKRQKNLYGSSNSRSGSNLLSRKTTQKQDSQESPNKLGKKVMIKSNLINKEQKIDSKTVIVSDFAITEVENENMLNVQVLNSRQALAQLISQKTNENNKYFNLKNIQKNHPESLAKGNDKKNDKIINNNQNFDDQQKKMEIQHCETYVPFDYYSVNLKDEQPYENYMRFHLRNSIIEVLEKKGKRYSLSKLGTKIVSKQKGNKQVLIEESKKNSARISDRNLKSTQRINAGQKYKAIHSHAKSYRQILGNLRH